MISSFCFSFFAPYSLCLLVLRIIHFLFLSSIVCPFLEIGCFVSCFLLAHVSLFSNMLGDLVNFLSLLTFPLLALESLPLLLWILLHCPLVLLSSVFHSEKCFLIVSLYHLSLSLICLVRLFLGGTLCLILEPTLSFLLLVMAPFDYKLVPCQIPFLIVELHPSVSFLLLSSRREVHVTHHSPHVPPSVPC